MQVGEFTQEQRQFVRRTLQGHVAFYPPASPREVAFDGELVSALSTADRALGELSGVGKRLRNPAMLIRPYLHREAMLSSRIEGIQSSLSELILFEAEAPTARPEDAREVVNYVRALEWGIGQLDKLAVSLRLVRELHRRLLSGVRGENQTPGEFRRTQNWIAPKGTPIERAMFVPPPPEVLNDLLNDWEKFVHEQDHLPPLVRCALLHYQFETIHPFTDGNGRVGRLLMPIFLIERGCLSQPLLYLSGYFERERTAYYAALSEGRTSGDLRPWLLLFLDAVATQSLDAAERADQLTRLEADFRERIAASRSRVTHTLIDYLFSNLYVVARNVATRQKVTFASAQAAIEDLVDAKILSEMTGRKHGRVYAATEMLEIIDRAVASKKRRR